MSQVQWVIYAKTFPDKGTFGQSFVAEAAITGITETLWSRVTEATITSLAAGDICTYDNGRWEFTGLNLHIGNASLTQAAVYALMKMIERTSDDLVYTPNDANNQITISFSAAILAKINGAVQKEDLALGHRWTVDGGSDLASYASQSHPAFSFRFSNGIYVSIDQSSFKTPPAGVTVNRLYMTKWLNRSRNYANATGSDFVEDNALDFNQLRENGGVVYFQANTYETGTRLARPDDENYIKVTLAASNPAPSNNIYQFNVSSIEFTGTPSDFNSYYIFHDKVVTGLDRDARDLVNVPDLFAREIASPTKFLTEDATGVGKSNPPVSSQERTNWDSAATRAATAVQPQQLDKTLRFFQLWQDALTVTNSTAGFSIFAGSTRFTKGSLNPTANATEVATWTKIKTSRMGRILPTTVNPDQNLINFSSDLAPFLTGTHDIRLYGSLLNGGIDTKNYVDIDDANITESNGIYDIDFDAGDATLTGTAITLDYNAWEYDEKGTQPVNVYNIRGLDDYLDPWAKRSDFKEQTTSYYIFFPSTGNIANTSEGEAQFRTSANALVAPGAQSLTITEMDSVAFMDIHQDLVITPDLKPYFATFGGNNPALNRTTELTALSTETKVAYLIPGNHKQINTLPASFTPRPDLGHYIIKFNTGFTRPNTMTFRLPISDMIKVGNPTVGGDPNTWFELTFEARDNRFIEIYGHAIKEADGMLDGEQEGTNAWAYLTMNQQGVFGFSERTVGSEVTLTTSWQDILTGLDDDTTITGLAKQDVSGGGSASFGGRFGDIRTDSVLLEIPVNIRKSGNKLQAQLSMSGLSNYKIRAVRSGG